MSETTKLETLLNKTKSSIPFVVRKKQPVSTNEFLEYAKEVEELLQLSNIDANHSIINTHNTKFPQSISSQVTAPLLPLRQSFENSVDNNFNHYPRYTNHDYRFSNNRNNYCRRNVSNPHSQFARNVSQHDRDFSSANRQRAVSNYTNAYRKPLQVSRSNARHNIYSQNSTVNTIGSLSSSSKTEPLQEMYTISTNNQGQQFECQGSACPNF